MHKRQTTVGVLLLVQDEKGRLH